MIITNEIREAIQKAVEIAGNPNQLSKRMEGIRHTTIRDWLSGKTKSISDENWKKLYPVLDDIFAHEGEFVPVDDEYIPNYTSRAIFERHSPYKLSEIEQKRLHKVINTVVDLKERYKDNEIEFSFSARVVASDNQKFNNIEIDSESDFDIETFSKSYKIYD